ncbi:MAG TPA: hypothetical protein VFF90_04525 [Saprospiraceae bacterium]|nr:hypothetical protein [Saprospiraceae bacterium]
MKIVGKVVLLPFEGGAYGIEDDHGKKYLPINMPNQLKKDGARVTCSVRKEDVESMIMWGEPVYITSFETLS